MEPVPRARHRRSEGAFRLRAGRGRILTTLLAATVLVLAAWVAGMTAPELAMRSTLRQELAVAGTEPAVRAFYAARGYRPLWLEAHGAWPTALHSRIRPAALERAARVAGLGGGSAQPERSARSVARWTLAGELGAPRKAARVEIALTGALAERAAAMAAARAQELAFVDPAFPPVPPPVEFLHWAGGEASAIQDVGKVNALYDQLADNLEAYRAQWASLPQFAVPGGPPLAQGDRGARVRALRGRLGLPDGDRFDPALAAALTRFQTAHGLPASGGLDDSTLRALNLGASHFEALIALNLRRTMALPPPLSDRFILVNPAAGRLWFYEGRRPVGSMKVVVGSRAEQTPSMVGVIRYMVYNPYWEVPVDIAREAVARAAVRQGPAYLSARRLEVLSDWSDAPTSIPARDVDWAGVAAGRREIRLRQAPGPGNVMGSLKFMMPNELGIYLHDTPEKALFQAPDRQRSAGCVRVERAGDLAAWIRREPGEDPRFRGPDETVDEFAPVTVYIAYLTAAPTPDGVAFYPDVYGRDALRP
jgi:murein L,D-transpeptidase YcbB/YkuD